MTPSAFIRKWKASNLKEGSAAQEHFIDLCTLLGGVDELFDHSPYRCERQEREKALARFVIARSHTAKWLEAVEKALHVLASLVRFFMRDHGLLPVVLRGDHRDHGVGLERGAHVMTVIATIHDRLLPSVFLEQWRNDRREARGIMAWATGEAERHASRFV